MYAYYSVSSHTNAAVDFPRARARDLFVQVIYRGFHFSLFDLGKTFLVNKSSYAVMKASICTSGKNIATTDLRTQTVSGIARKGGCGD
jgi:hypothetical protein